MRKVLWAVLVVGAMLIAAPFALGMPAKADGGQQMLDDFRPLMQQGEVDKTAAYYYDVFSPLGDVVVPAMTDENMAKFDAYLAGISGMRTDAAAFIPGLAQALGMTEAEVQAFIGAQYPDMAQMLANLPQMEADFGQLLGLMSSNVDTFQQVPAGLDHYEGLVTTMESSVGNYADADSLPDFRLFTWFFVVPGAVLVALAGFGLLTTRQPAVAGSRSTTRRHGPQAAHP
ncbi:MAG: hypothetical protein ACLGI8_14020 [Acidimicrobiia bacterium]|jgi:hypothetical protein